MIINLGELKIINIQKELWKDDVNNNLSHI